MRNILLTTVATFGLALAPAAFAPAFAQVNGTTQNPPSPNASSQMPQPMNSAPVGSTAAAPQAHPAGALGGPVATVPSSPSKTMAAMPMKKPVHVFHARSMPKRDPMVQDASMTDSSVPPTSAYRGGVGSPLSTQATDLKPSAGEKMGSRLPMPPTSGDTPRDLLTAAQTALNKGQTGAAQQALEMAETRILSRTTDPSMANAPDQRAMVANIDKARQALGSRDMNGAKQAIAMALNDRVPPPGPAVTTGPAGTPATMMRTN
jgi:hypothetical protein